VAARQRRGKIVWRWLTAAAVVLVPLLAPARTGAEGPPPRISSDSFSWNDQFIASVNGHTDIDLADPRQMFRLVFSHLGDEVIIYPSENYYYFTVDFQGRTVLGSISLFPEDRDKGVLNFGYMEKVDKFQQPCFPVRGGSAAFTAKDGVVVTRIDAETYSVTFEGHTRVFRLFHLDLTPPKRARLTDDEVFVAPEFDESGLMFYLIFNKVENHFYWILDEDVYVAEHFHDYGSDVIFGDRTEFAFYLDRAHDRKILIGVDGFNVMEDNYYDGPFDQMPDNLVRSGRLNLQQYLEKAYPDTKGQIDQYGNYLNWYGVRVAVTPYLNYFSRDDVLNVARTCTADALPQSRFYACLTQQIFQVPDTVADCSKSGVDYAEPGPTPPSALDHPRDP
jgi:hypothetical protein